MRHVRFHIFHIPTAPLMAATVGVLSYYARAAAIRLGDGAQASLVWTDWGHEDGLRRGIQRVGGVVLIGEVTPDSKDVTPQAFSRYDLTIHEPAVAQRDRELQRIVTESEKTEARNAEQQLYTMGYSMRSQYFLQCLDNSLEQGLGLQLADFKWPSYPKPLRSPDKREFEAVEAERPYGEARAWGGSQKSLIVDTLAGQRHVEVPVLGKPPQVHLPPSLHLCIDWGPIGFPGSMWLFGRH